MKLNLRKLTLVFFVCLVAVFAPRNTEAENVVASSNSFKLTCAIEFKFFSVDAKAYDAPADGAFISPQVPGFFYSKRPKLERVVSDDHSFLNFKDDDFSVSFLLSWNRSGPLEHGINFNLFVRDRPTSRIFIPVDTDHPEKTKLQFQSEDLNIPCTKEIFGDYHPVYKHTERKMKASSLSGIVLNCGIEKL